MKEYLSYQHLKTLSAEEVATLYAEGQTTRICAYDYMKHYLHMSPSAIHHTLDSAFQEV